MPRKKDDLDEEEVVRPPYEMDPEDLATLNYDHHPVVRTLTVSVKGQVEKSSYLAYIRKYKAGPTTYKMEVREKKKGRWIDRLRTVFIPPWDEFEIYLSDMDMVWKGIVNYKKNNMARVKGTEDDTWNEDEFLPRVQKGLQDVDQTKLQFNHTISINTPKLQLDMREVRKDGSSLAVMVPVILAPELDMKMEDFMAMCRPVLYDQACCFIRSSRLTRLQRYISDFDEYVSLYLGPLINIDTLIGIRPEKEWSVLQIACYLGKVKIVQWLVDERNADIHRASVDGMFPLACACLNGHEQVVHYLIGKGADFLREVPSTGYHSINLLMHGKFKKIVRELIGPDSDYTKELILKHGCRPDPAKPNCEGLGKFNLLKEYFKAYPDDSLGWSY